MFGWNSELYFDGFEVAAKTGTDTEYRDAWAIGYTTTLSAGVWAGNNDRSVINRAGALGVRVSAPCWHEFMAKAMTYYPPGSFNKPSPLSPEEKSKLAIPMLNGYYVNSQEYKNNITGEIKTQKEVHNILYYINRENPLGSRPLNPYNDSQFMLWEMPVLLWAQQNIPNFNNEYNQIPGKDYSLLNPSKPIDNVIEFPDVPQINFISPESGTFVSNDFNIEVKIDSTDSINATKIYLNQKLLGSLNKKEENIYTFKINWHELTNQNEIKIEAFDSFNQKGENSLIIFK